MKMTLSGQQLWARPQNIKNNNNSVHFLKENYNKNDKCNTHTVLGICITILTGKKLNVSNRDCFQAMNILCNI